MATAVCDALWGSTPITTFMTASLVVCEPRGHSCLRMFVLDPLLSHSVGEALAGRSSQESHPAQAGGRHYESDPARTPNARKSP